MSNLSMLFVLVFFFFCFFFSVLISIVITSLGEERAGLFAFRVIVCLLVLCMRPCFSSSRWQGLAAACDFLLTFFKILFSVWLFKD